MKTFQVNMKQTKKKAAGCFDIDIVLLLRGRHLKHTHTSITLLNQPVTCLDSHDEDESMDVHVCVQYAVQSLSITHIQMEKNETNTCTLTHRLLINLTFTFFMLFNIMPSFILSQIMQIVP